MTISMIAGFPSLTSKRVVALALNGQLPTFGRKSQDPQDRVSPIVRMLSTNL